MKSEWSFHEEDKRIKRKEIFILILIIIVIAIPILVYNLKEKEMLPPTLVLLGEKTIEIEEGEEYKEAGYKATDEKGEDLTSNVTIRGNVNVNTPGKYKVEYKITDSQNHTVIKKRTVVVKEKKVERKEPPKESECEKIIYLTYDDGPGPYTEKLLEILEKNEAYATFFVTNQYKEYRYLMPQIIQKGNSIGIHSYSHKYDLVYQNQAEYFDDLKKMSDIIKKETGEKTKLLRFPGGSSNTISKKYSIGIMKKLVKEVEKKGYHYYDWNVDSDDAGRAKTKEQVVENVINGVKDKKKAVVLQHDVKEYSVEATKEIIKWGKKNGYTFLPLKYDSFDAHHGVNN